MAAVYHNPIMPVAVVPVDMMRVGLSSLVCAAANTNRADVPEASSMVMLPAPAA